MIDIERRIRRCEETYKAVRVKKTPIHLDKQRHVFDDKRVDSVANKSANDLLADTMLNKSIHPEINCSILSTSHEGNAYTNSSIPRLAEKNKTNLLLNVQNSSMKHDSDPVNSCTAARTRSVQQWQKRKLFNLSKFEKTSPSIICGCGDSWTPCVLCKRSSPMLPKVTQRQDFRDRVALMDLSFHPVLSFETGKRKYVWRIVLGCMRNVHGCDLRIVKEIPFHLWLAFLKITTACIEKRKCNVLFVLVDNVT